MNISQLKKIRKKYKYMWSKDRSSLIVFDSNFSTVKVHDSINSFMLSVFYTPSNKRTYDRLVRRAKIKYDRLVKQGHVVLPKN